MWQDIDNVELLNVGEEDVESLREMLVPGLSQDCKLYMHAVMNEGDPAMSNEISPATLWSK